MGNRQVNLKDITEYLYYLCQQKYQNQAIKFYNKCCQTWNFYDYNRYQQAIQEQRLLKVLKQCFTEY